MLKNKTNTPPPPQKDTLWVEEETVLCWLGGDMEDVETEG